MLTEQDSTLNQPPICNINMELYGKEVKSMGCLKYITYNRAVRTGPTSLNVVKNSLVFIASIILFFKKYFFYVYDLLSLLMMNEISLRIQV